MLCINAQSTRQHVCHIALYLFNLSVYGNEEYDVRENSTAFASKCLPYLYAGLYEAV